jgi:BlaI family penicillinase repressor
MNSSLDIEWKEMPTPMARKSSPQPTDVELAMLRVLWRRGPSTVREVHLALQEQADRKTGYSTTLKMMQVMLEKELLRRDDSRRPQIYAPTQPEEQTQRQMVNDLLNKVFGGSARKLVMRAVESERVSADELAEIRTLLKKMEGEKP